MEHGVMSKEKLKNPNRADKKRIFEIANSVPYRPFNEEKAGKYLSEKGKAGINIKCLVEELNYVSYMWHVKSGCTSFQNFSHDVIKFQRDLKKLEAATDKICKIFEQDIFYSALVYNGSIARINFQEPSPLPEGVSSYDSLVNTVEEIKKLRILAQQIRKSQPGKKPQLPEGMIISSSEVHEWLIGRALAQIYKDFFGEPPQFARNVDGLYGDGLEFFMWSLKEIGIPLGPDSIYRYYLGGRIVTDNKKTK
jgi:hypothetical protein